VTIEHHQNQKLDSQSLQSEGSFYSEITLVKSIQEISGDWCKLESLGGNSFFLSWFWIANWAEECSKKTQLYLFKTYRDGSLIGMCFLTIVDIKRHWGLVQSKQVQINEYKNKGFDLVNQYNNILCVREYDLVCWLQLFNQLEEWSNRWDEIFISSLPERMYKKLDGLPNRYNRNINKEHCTWCGKLNEKSTSIASILSNFKRKSRQQLRQSLKVVNQKFGDIKIIRAQDNTTAKKYFEEMKKLHTKRWNRQGEEGVFFDSCWVSMHQGLIDKGVNTGEIILLKIFTVKPGTEVHTQTLGYLYGHIYRNKVYMQQTGFMISSDNRVRPGYVSHLYAMNYCAKMGLVEYDFLPSGKKSYKKFFCSSENHLFWVSWQKRRFVFAVENLTRRCLTWYKKKFR
jgi:CelD/BcsL family acetyltransferase involved in cellulose biosynthesis